MRWVGIDPGQTGALCVVGDDGLTVLARASWSRVSVPPDLTSYMIGAKLVVIEGVYVSRLNRRSGIVLAQWVGQLLAQVPADVPIEQPQPSKWRAAVLGGRFANCTRERAKEAAIAAATANAIGDWGGSDHHAEAWCMARYARFRRS